MLKKLLSPQPRKLVYGRHSGEGIFLGGRGSNFVIDH